MVRGPNLKLGLHCDQVWVLGRVVMQGHQSYPDGNLGKIVGVEYITGRQKGPRYQGVFHSRWHEIRHLGRQDGYLFQYPAVPRTLWCAEYISRLVLTPLMTKVTLDGISSHLIVWFPALWVNYGPSQHHRIKFFHFNGGVDVTHNAYYVVSILKYKELPLEDMFLGSGLLRSECTSYALAREGATFSSPNKRDLDYPLLGSFTLHPQFRKLGVSGTPPGYTFAQLVGKMLSCSCMGPHCSVLSSPWGCCFTDPGAGSLAIPFERLWS